MTRPAPSPTAPDKRPRVSVRLDREFLDLLREMQDQFPTADGSRATLSDVLRAVLKAGRALFARVLWKRVTAFAAAAKRDPWEIVGEAVAAGLDAMGGKK